MSRVEHGNSELPGLNMLSLPADYIVQWRGMSWNPRSKEVASIANASDCILEVTYSNHDQKTDYFDWGFIRIFSVPQDKFRNNTLKLDMITSFHILPHFLFIKHRSILRYIHWFFLNFLGVGWDW
jgi:hypothetical protein